MTGFAETQTKLLAGKLPRKHVKTRELQGKTVSYIEGWHTIAEANRIFGFDGWDRETVWADCVWEDGRRDLKACTYAVRVRVRVRAGDTIVCREGSGVGHGTGTTLGEAHEGALKEAETDAMKRALVTFGNLFGLALYDREQRGVRGTAPPDLESPRLAWTVRSADGHVIARCIDAKSFCTRLRQAIGAASDASFLQGLWTQNAPIVESLRAHRPDLITRKGAHYATVLERVFEGQLEQLSAVDGEECVGAGVDKFAPAVGAPRRIRDKEHLQSVAGLPCHVCARAPSQPHHLRFTQLRALGRKVSDEWVVPLCNLHHRALHDAGDEEAWWHEHGIDALEQAKRLWQERRVIAEASPPASQNPNEAGPTPSGPQ